MERGIAASFVEFLSLLISGDIAFNEVMLLIVVKIKFDYLKSNGAKHS